MLKLQFIVDSVTSSQSVWNTFGLISTVALSVEGMYTVDEFPYCNKGANICNKNNSILLKKMCRSRVGNEQEMVGSCQDQTTV